MSDEDSSAEDDSCPRSRTRPSGAGRSVDLDISITAPAWGDSVDDIVMRAESAVDAALARAGVDGTARTVVWLLATAAVLVLAVPVIRRAPAPTALVATAAVLGFVYQQRGGTPQPEPDED